MQRGRRITFEGAGVASAAAKGAGQPTNVTETESSPGQEAVPETEGRRFSPGQWVFGSVVDYYLFLALSRYGGQING